MSFCENIQRLFSPEALVPVCPTVLSLKGELPEFCFFRFSSNKTYWNRLSVVLSGKEENDTNYGILRSLVKLFDSLVRTTIYPRCQRAGILYNASQRSPRFFGETVIGDESIHLQGQKLRRFLASFT